MSLILTHISKLGIVHAADSNLTTSSGSAAGVGKKVFEVSYLKAGLCLAGSYSVGGVRMDTWMPQAIADYLLAASPSLAGFAECLRGRLETEMTASEKAGGCLVHIAAFIQDPSGDHAEFYFVRNITGIDPNNGSYSGMGQKFTVSEDFWHRDFAAPSVRAALSAGSRFAVYINGFPAGRIAYLGLMQHFESFLRAVWNTPGWLFRPPKTLAEVADLLELQLNAIGTMFKISDYSAPYIGGSVQTLHLAAA